MDNLFQLSSICTLEQLQQQFPTEESCIDFFYHMKWPSGFVCPHCSHTQEYLIRTRRLPLFECLRCRHQTSLTAGTIMAGSRTSLHKWLTAIFLVSRTEQGINAVALSRIIRVTYKTAWLILHKIRQAIHIADQSILLSGTTQVNTAVYGRPYNPYFRNHPSQHFLLAGSSLNDQGETSYLKIKLVSTLHVRNKMLQRAAATAFSKQHIESTAANVEFVTGRFHPKRFRHLLAYAAQAGKFINDTFHGIGRKHLQLYLDEFCFKINLSLQHLPIFQHLTRLCANPGRVVAQNMVALKPALSSGLPQPFQPSPPLS
ncbi:transposase [Paenibacillus sp. GCM10023248]|uniref:transposase n=1 Tax=Bacillales TaxID=1385 RepID=UPI002378E364|nr:MULTISPECIES: transposase [Bacillales]MDD9270204.1 transposase [Paenibacillus sp. MAHUQ-63]MDR6880338.1 Zn ribbon nucleic-acid-binding protein [Bacillus sp. 3255]